MSFDPTRFWRFLVRYTEYNLIAQAIILYLQIPHMVWVADIAFLKARILAGISTPLDFLLYGIDLIEWIAIVNITLLIIARIKTRRELQR